MKNFSETEQSEIEELLSTTHSPIDMGYKTPVNDSGLIVFSPCNCRRCVKKVSLNEKYRRYLAQYFPVFRRDIAEKLSA